MTVKPVRLQLSRKRGFNLQELSRATNGLEAVVVTRASKRWGNPYYVGMFRGYRDIDAVAAYRKWLAGDIGARGWAGAPPTKAEIRGALAGKNLACACGPTGTCHADILLAIANSQGG